MIVPYFGEFLVSPIPLELSLNYCSAKCAYCFANLNKPDRTANVRGIMSLLSTYHERNTLEAELLKQGYPVLMSNKVDPFAHSNYQQAIPIMRTLTELGIQICVQTRGGVDVDKALEFLPPSVWYVSIPFDNESLRKKIEPGATTIESRFKLIEKLTSLNHRVVLGMNPLIPEWTPDTMNLLKRAKDAGAEGVWIETLHLNYKQIAAMTDKEKANIGEEILSAAQKRKQKEEWFNHFLNARNEAEYLDLEVFSNGQPARSDFFQPYRDVYKKTFPVAQDFVNHCFDNEPEGLIDFADFTNSLQGELPKNSMRLESYIGSTAHQVLKDTKLPARMTYRQLLAFIYQESRCKTSPVNINCFALAGIESGEDEYLEVRDENRLPYLIFDSCGHESKYADLVSRGILTRKEADQWLVQAEAGKWDAKDAQKA